MTTGSASPEGGTTGDGGAARSLRDTVTRPAREALGVAEFAAGIWHQRARLWVAGRFHRDPDGRLHLRAGRRDPYAVYADVRAAGSFARLRAGDRVTASHRVCRTVLRSRGFGVRPETDPALTGAAASPTAGIDLGFLDRNPPDHTRLRRLVAPAFSPKMMAGYRPQIEAVADELLDAAAAKGRFDLIRDFATPLPVAVITTLLGIDSADTDALARHGQAVGTALDGIRSVRHARTLMTAAAGLQQMFTDLIARRRAEPADDLVSRLLVAEDAGELTANELFVTCHLLLVAGFETTVNLIGNGTAALLDHPEQWGALRANPDRAPAAVEEVLRYDPPVQSTYRFALADTEIDDERFRAGDGVELLLGGTGRDPKVYDDSDRFDIGRVDPPDHLAFSAGIHYCVGAPLARLEADIAFRALATRLPLLARAGRPTRRRSVAIRGFAAYPVTAG